MTDKPTAREQLVELIELVLIEQAQDNGKHPSGTELVLVDSKRAAEAATDRILPKLQATIDYHAAMAGRYGD